MAVLDEKLGITKVITIHPQVEMNFCTRSNTCSDILLQITNFNFIKSQRMTSVIRIHSLCKMDISSWWHQMKNQETTKVWGLSSGEHECLQKT